MNDGDQTRLLIATLAGCFIRATEARSPGVTKLFCKELAGAHASMKEWESPPSDVLQGLIWADEQARVPR